MVDNQLDTLKVDDVILTKTKHQAPKLENKSNNEKVSDEELDDILFHSTSAPQLTLSQMEEITVTPIKAKKAKLNG